MNEKTVLVAIAAAPAHASVVVATPNYKPAPRLAAWLAKAKYTDSRDWAMTVRDLKRFPRRGRFEGLQRWLDGECRDARTLIGSAAHVLIAADASDEIAGLSFTSGLLDWLRVTRPGRQDLCVVVVDPGQKPPTAVPGEGVHIGRARLLGALYELLPEGGPPRLKVEPRGPLADELKRELAAGAAKRAGEAPADLLVAAALAAYELAQYADAVPVRVA